MSESAEKTDPHPPARVLSASTPGTAVVAPAFPEARLLKGDVHAIQAEVERAQEALRAAEAEAAQVLAEARAQADAIRTQARAEATAAAHAQFGALLASLERQSEEQERVFAEAVQRQAFLIARQVIRAELTLNPARVIQIVEEVAREARRYRRLELRLHPEDAALLEPALPQLRRSLSFAEQLTLTADPEQPRYGVKVQTEMGAYFGGVQDRLDKVERLLFSPPAPSGGQT